MRRPPRLRRSCDRVVALAAATALVLGLAIVTPAPTVAQDDGDPEAPAGEIIPEPNSGEAPEEAGDRGGALQLALLGTVTLAVACIAVYLVGRSRPAREARARRVAAARAAAERREAGS